MTRIDLAWRSGVRCCQALLMRYAAENYRIAADNLRNETLASRHRHSADLLQRIAADLETMPMPASKKLPGEKP